MTNEEIKALSENEAEKKYPFIWPKNKNGEEIEMRVGQKNPPNSRKIKDFQNAYTTGFLSGYQKAQEQGMRWISASEFMPKKEGRYSAKRLGEPVIVEAVLRKNGMVFCIPGSNNSIYPSFRSTIEWLYDPKVIDQK